MSKHLEGLQGRPTWLSYLGAVHGCLDWLGVDVSDAWLSGGTGHAFFMHMVPNADPGGPIGWDGLCVSKCGDRTDHGAVIDLQTNVGFRTESVCRCPHGRRADEVDEDSAKEAAWRFVRDNIDRGVPCIGYELAYPEFFTIAGYDDTGYYYFEPGPGMTPGTIKGPAPWQSVSPDVHWVRFSSVEAHPPAPDDVVVRQALSRITERTLHPQAPDWGTIGPAAYEVWAKALDDGTAQGFGHRYCTATWTELRRNAVAFLREAKERLPGRADDLFDDALAHYQVVAAKLRALHELHPFMDPCEDTLQSHEAAALIREAGAAETLGLPVLARIAEALG